MKRRIPDTAVLTEDIETYAEEKPDAVLTDIERYAEEGKYATAYLKLEKLKPLLQEADTGQQIAISQGELGANPLQSL